MNSKEYIKDMLKDTSKKELLDIIDLIRYIARDNEKRETDYFLEDLQDIIEEEF